VFTGLVQELGAVEGLERESGGARLAIRAGLAADLRPGDSVAVNGVCLTARQVHDRRFEAEAMNETLERTALGGLRVGARVNLELPLRVSDRLGGHLVQGHVDGVGEVAAVRQDGIARRVEVSAPAEILRYLISKGSVAVDGVSLTVVEVDERSFTVSLIPETLERTTLGEATPGRKLNLEVDLLAKYVEQLVAAR
jgi:riboflavin synthase